MKKICPICGEEFEGRSNQKFCKKQHYHICEVCGKEFPITVYQVDKKTCSKECHDILCVKNQQLSIEKSVYHKVCKICGKEFDTHYNHQTICDNEHFGTCVICGNQFKYKNGNYNVKTCSPACNAELTKRVCLEKYGAIAPIGNAEVKEKSKQTCLERYGTENPGQAEEVITRRKHTMIEKYGVEYSWQNPELRAKAQETMKERHGGTHISRCPALVSKMIENSQAKYGTNWPVQSDEVKAKAKLTMLQRYDVDNAFKSEHIKLKIQETNLRKYGVAYASQHPGIRARIVHNRIEKYIATIDDPIKRENLRQFENDPVRYIENHFQNRPTIHEVQESIGGMDLSTIYAKLTSEEGARLLSRVRSAGEDELEEFIHSLNPDIIILKDCRSIISPKEIDLYLPEYKIGFEINPTYTHNSSLPSFNADKPLSPTYHKMKSKLCEDKGVFLFHIFGYEWSIRQNIIKSMIANLLGLSTNRYYARNLHVEEISAAESRQFLNANHRQGATNARVCLGLRTNDGKLISLMTFGKVRPTIGKTQKCTEDTWELSRFCSLLNTSVVGGASKLFKHFCKNYKFDTILSFSDKAHTRGNLYQTLGFEQVNVSEPNYVWVKLDDDSYKSRVSCQKKNLPSMFHEPDLDISEGHTEKMIMMEHGYVQVFDSGTIRWEYTGK